MYYLACFGDSLVQGFPFGPAVSWTAALETTQKIKVLNYGICGDCTDDIFDRMRYRPLPEYVKHIVFLGGANDVLNGVPEKFTLTVLDKVVRWCEEQGYMLCLVLPLISSDELLNRRLLNLKQDMELRYREKAFCLDLQPAIGMDAASRRQAYLDGVHPKASTYKAMGEYAYPLLLKWLEQG